MESNTGFNHLGVFSKDKKIFLFYQRPDDRQRYFRIDSSGDGFDFDCFAGRGEIVKTADKLSEDGKREKIVACRDFRVAKVDDNYCLTYKFKAKNRTSLGVARSQDLLRWSKLGEIPVFGQTGMLVPDYQHRGRRVLYFGEESIFLAWSRDLTSWKVAKKPIFELPDELKEEHSIKIADLIPVEKGVVLIFYFYEKPGLDYSIRALLMDKKNPQKHLWETDKILWKQTTEWANRRIRPIGTAVADDRLFSYWQDEDGQLFALSGPDFKSILEEPEPSVSPTLKKFWQNPILKPIVDHFWESKAVFNPAVVSGGGKVHIVYRAVGETATSVLGYASSHDGVKIDERLPRPIYAPNEPFEGAVKTPRKFCALGYVSGGGGGGGCEDPRITKIGDRFYMIYVAYDGGSPPRLALTSISEADFLAKRWRWQKPVLISRPGVVDKSGCLLPEKVNGKYVIFHRVFPDILIDLVDDLDFNGRENWLKSEFAISPREGCWDSRKVGISAPPIKTEAGWLAIYNGVDDRDDSKYQIGAMLLDLNDPTRVISRPTTSSLAPTEDYENEGLKYGVVYSCGTAVVDGELLVYYGGSDEVVCLASAPLNDFLADLKYTGSARLEPITRPVNQIAKRSSHAPS